ncbi:hypothetical protein FIBSPDRAFT_875216, partial [Athelia psychrophila]
MNPGDGLQLGPIILPTRTLWPVSSSSILVSDRTDFHPPSKWALFGFCLTHVRPAPWACQFILLTRYLGAPQM